MKQPLLSLSLLGFVLALMAPISSADTIHDSQGFEAPAYSTGPLNGQNGWIGAGVGGGIEPMVVTSPDPVIDSQAVRLEIPDIQGAASNLDLPIADLLAAGYDYITVSFDIYRQTDAWLSNLWWWWYDVGTPTYGIQWDQPPPFGETYPFGWDGTGTPTVLDNWAKVEMTWDFDSGLAMGYYDGQLVTTVNISGISSLTGWAFSLAHDEGTGSGPEVAWLDNFEIFATTGPTLLIDPDPLQSGLYADFTIVNAGASMPTFLAYSLVGPGSTPVPPLQVTLGLANPVQAGGMVTADLYGTADWTLYVPTFAAGRSVWFQGVQFQLITNVVATSVQ